MPKLPQTPVVLTPAQKIQSWRQQAQTLRMIAASSRNENARATLIARAADLERQADEAERA